MTRPAWLVAAGVAAFLVFLVGGVPAALALRWLAPDALRMNGVSGTLWRGSATGADIGKLHLADTTWTLSPLALLTGRLGGDVETRIGDGTAHGAVAVSRAGDLRCTACAYEGPVASLRAAIPALRTLDGQLSLQLSAFEIRKKWPTRAVGTVNLTNVPIAAAGQARRDSPMATIAATVGADPVPDNGLIAVSVQDAGGPLELTAHLNFTPPGNFEFSGRAKARPGAPADLVNALAAMGTRGSDGSTELGLSGTFF